MHLPLINVHNNKLSQTVTCQLFCILVTHSVDKCSSLADFALLSSTFLAIPVPLSMRISLGNENASYHLSEKKKVNTDAKTLHIMHIKAKYKLFLKLSAVVAYCCQCGLFY